MFIYVGNLSLEVTESDLRSEFTSFGEVNSVVLMNDLSIGSGQGRGCGFVEMPSVMAGESAIESLQGKSIKGRKLEIIKALPVTRKVNNTEGNTESDRLVSGFSRTTKYWGSKWRK